MSIYGLGAAGRSLCALALVGGLTAAAATPAMAQSACGASYRVAPGDTLSKIAARCGTSVGALVQANPRITDPSRIAVGWTLAMPSSGYAAAPQPTYRAPAAPASSYPAATARTTTDPYLAGYGQPNSARGTYAVQPGDTMGAIAQALGVSLTALLSQNGGVDPAGLLIGQLLNLPTGAAYDPRYDDGRDARRDPARLSLSKDDGRPGTEVEMKIRNLDRRERLGVGVRAPSGDLLRLGQVRADKDGRAKAKVEVPEWADPGDELVFFVERSNGRFVRSEPFLVTGRRARDDRNNGVIGRADSRLEGWIVRGVECPVLRATNGRTYALVSNDVSLPLGAYVQLRGDRTGVSFCQEGSATIDVADLRQVEPPR